MSKSVAPPPATAPLAAPCPLDAVFAADATVDRSAYIARWKAIDDANESYATVADLPTGPSIDAAVAKLAARRCHPVARRAVPGQVGSEVAYFSVQLLGPEAGAGAPPPSVKRDSFGTTRDSFAAALRQGGAAEKANPLPAIDPQ